MSRRRALGVAAWLLLGCGHDERSVSPEDAGRSPALDTPVMAYLSMARARHHEANVCETSRDSGCAVEALKGLAHAPLPHPGTTIPEVEEVLADTYARLAELDLAANRIDAAAGDVADGLGHARDPTYFRGHLLEVSGIIEETRSNLLSDAGRIEEADRARKRAIALLDEAVVMQEQVVQQTTGEAGATP